MSATLPDIATPVETPPPARPRMFSATGVAGLALLSFLAALAVLGPILVPWTAADRDFEAFLSPPSVNHPFGTTPSGGDILVLTLLGLRRSLLIGLVVAVAATTVAALVGAFAGYFLGWVDRTLMWVTDLLLVIPAFLVVAVVSSGQDDWIALVVLLAAFMWMVTAKAVRGAAIAARDREYVKAARFMGVPSHRVVLRHVVPNLASLLVADATVNVSAAILAETSLAYFGFGVVPPDVSLGSLIADGAPTALYAPWTFWWAAGLLIALIVAVNLVGDDLRDRFDPSLRAHS
ncbi:ABC transporter permease [Herbidospora sp. NBRC 101105]|uniref:ABC transporter permease n=1 Tax=Herbidospora sp. NBRC 101105 TaxID=3032195 RepID=UPI0024A1AF6E|nr:ABC transporter permease [Herbidospora sp. NBRC 101105]GLX94621.1 putative peptide transport permease protein [Herbidospora sp. NBRC 101105]